MKKNGRMLIVLCVFMFFLFQVSALAAAQEPYHLKLLAVREENGGYVGSEADLYLELKEGSGRVFLETFPLTKMDTQLSTRFAKEIACNHFKLNCNKYDFIYTIKADSNIIGGPSAGAAIAALTTIAVLDLDYDEEIAITGTINSGGLIGPVGGIKEKLEAAAKAGLKKVLVAKGARKMQEEKVEGILGESNITSTNTTDDNITNANITNANITNINATDTNTPDTNTTLPSKQSDLIEYAKNNLSIEAIEVMDLDEVMFYFTGIDLNHKDIQITMDPEYNQIMSSLQSLLCKRAQNIETELRQNRILIDVDMNKTIAERKEKADNATKQGEYYTAASYCFGLNILLKSHYYDQKNVTEPVLQKLFLTLQQKVTDLELKLTSQKIETISDLQTIMVVKERLGDVKTQIETFSEPGLTIEEKRNLYSYAEERYFSALSWMQFFAMDGKKLVLDQNKLKESCMLKISEAEEREQYVGIFIGDALTQGIKEKIDYATEALDAQEYDLCLIRAIQAKGEANAILSTLGLDLDFYDEFINSKSKAVERIIAENSNEGLFPILGYSYFQYATSLKEEDKYATIIYLEYALEMSDLGVYFPEEKQFLEKVSSGVPSTVLNPEFVFRLEGFIAGALVVIFFVWIKPKYFTANSWKKKPKKKK
ncbi:MAG: S16 family serine protease [Nanoarchaeota archaeon]